MGRKTDRLAAIEETLSALVEAVNANADEHAERQDRVLDGIAKLGERVDGLAEAVRAVMAARTARPGDPVGSAGTARKAPAGEKGGRM